MAAVTLGRVGKNTKNKTQEEEYVQFSFINKLILPAEETRPNSRMRSSIEVGEVFQGHLRLTEREMDFSREKILIK